MSACWLARNLALDTEPDVMLANTNLTDLFPSFWRTRKRVLALALRNGFGLVDAGPTDDKGPATVSIEKVLLGRLSVGERQTGTTFPRTTQLGSALAANLRKQAAGWLEKSRL